MKINKKGALSDTDKSLFWFIFVIPAIGLMVTLVFIAMPKIINSQTTISPSLQHHIYQSITVGSPLCFAYEDPVSNRVKNGYIDFEKFTDERLDDCLSLSERTEYGFFISLYKEGQYEKEIHTQNVLRRISSRRTEYQRPIILIMDEKEYNGYLLYSFY